MRPKEAGTYTYASCPNTLPTNVVEVGYDEVALVISGSTVGHGVPDPTGHHGVLELGKVAFSSDLVREK